MASFDLGNITSALSDLKEYGVSINGKALKLESEHDGNTFLSESMFCFLKSLCFDQFSQGLDRRNL